MKRWRRTSHSLARLGVLAACMSAVTVGQNGLEKERLLGITVNGRQVSESEAGKYYVPESIFLKGRLRLPPDACPPLGVDYYPLEAISGVRIAVDSEHQVLDISAPEAAFLDTRLDALDGAHVTASRPEPGLFLNHDFRLPTGPARRTLTGLVEGGMFSRLGVFTTQYVGRGLTNHVTPLRLYSQVFRDFPERMTTLTVGDTSSADAAWARRIYYAGVSFTKLATQPSFISTALPSLSGQADQPSTVSGNHTMHYNVFLDPSGSLVWGDGTAGTGALSGTLKLTAPSATKVYIVYGGIMGNQKHLTARSYLDDLIVTVTY